MPFNAFVLGCTHPIAQLLIRFFLQYQPPLCSAKNRRLHVRKKWLLLEFLTHEIDSPFFAIETTWYSIFLILLSLTTRSRDAACSIVYSGRRRKNIHCDSEICKLHANLSLCWKTSHRTVPFVRMKNLLIYKGSWSALARKSASL